MDNLIIKIGADLQKDLKEVFDNPAKAKKNTHTLYLKNAEEFCRVLSPKRFELLQYLIKHQTEKPTISEIAESLKRKQEAISRDANLLTKHALIQKTKQKQTTQLKTKYNTLEIKLG